MKVKQAVLMVGGLGTRLLPLTENRPKPILPVADKPCIWYLAKSMAEAGIEVVWTYVGFVRKKLKEIGADVEIRTVRGAGYSLEEKPC